VFIAILLGVFLMFAGLIYVAVTSGAPPGEGIYIAPSYKDGVITKPQFK